MDDKTREAIEHLRDAVGEKVRERLSREPPDHEGAQRAAVGYTALDNLERVLETDG